MNPARAAGRARVTRRLALLTAGMVAFCLLPNTTLGYSVLAHESIIDAMWDADITPALRARFPHVTREQLREAHGYAYGGAIIQDMGYYPFGSKTYSDMVHYARSGEFVLALLADAHDINEYAFAIGALGHYCADNEGHSIGVNTAVPILYPKLKRRYGANVLYEDKPSAHIQTEFGFDVVQVAKGNYAPEAYHDFIGFGVSKDLLQRAFVETYGIEMGDLFTNLDLALSTYRRSVSTVIPRITRVAWETRKHDIKGADTTGRGSARGLYRISRADYEKEWGATYQRPGLFSKVLAFVFRILPKIGPLKGFAMKPQTAETEQLFLKSVQATMTTFRRELTSMRAGKLKLSDRNLDTGKPSHIGDYRLADEAYTDLLHRAAERKYEHVSPSLRTNILAFFSDTTPRARTGRDAAAWTQTVTELQALSAKR